MKDPLRPYIVDDLDELAFELYRLRGFLPPERPDGFLDDDERDTWHRWREHVRVYHVGAGSSDALGKLIADEK